VRVGIVGSRRWPQPQRVQRFVANLAQKYPDVQIVSGGCPRPCVDGVAEAAALDLGLCVWSYRPEPALSYDLGQRPVLRLNRRYDDDEPYSLAEQKLVDEWKAAEEEYRARMEALRGKHLVALYKMQGEPEDGLHTVQRSIVLPERYDSFRDAALARNTLIVKVVDQLVAFHFKRSTGTGHARSEAERLRVPVHPFELGM
jgi:hypothetical protein